MNKSLDFLAEAANRRLKGESSSDRWVWDWRMTPHDKLQFDMFLVATGDPLAQEAGTPEWRFHERVRRMVEQEQSPTEA